jgi:hypothetical protein
LQANLKQRLVAADADSMNLAISRLRRPISVAALQIVDLVSPDAVDRFTKVALMAPPPSFLRLGIRQIFLSPNGVSVFRAVLEPMSWIDVDRGTGPIIPERQCNGQGTRTLEAFRDGPNKHRTAPVMGPVSL